MMGFFVIFRISDTTFFMPNGMTISKPILYAPTSFILLVCLTTFFIDEMLSTSRDGMMLFFNGMSGMLVTIPPFYDHLQLIFGYKFTLQGSFEQLVQIAQ